MSKTEELRAELKGLLDPGMNGLGKFLNTANAFIQSVGDMVEPFTKVQSAVIELTKAVGTAGSNIMALSKRMIAQNKAMSLSMSYGVSNQEMLRLQQEVMMSLGRNVAIDVAGKVLRNEAGEVVNPNYDSELENLVAAQTVFGSQTVSEMVAGYDHIGLSMNAAAKATGKLYKEAGKYGINLTKYAKNFTENLSMVQKYNFRNGVRGLQEMARKATEIRQDMSQVASFADKVGSVTGAVETAANLQVLGGSFTALASPLAMLNESLTNVEGLQDRMNNMARGRAHYNQRTHEIEMDPVTRMQMRRAAESMGIDPNNFIDTAYAHARREEIQRQMNISGVGGMNEEIRNLLKNVGTIDSETGAAGATIAGQFRTLAEIGGSDELQRQLIEENRSESEDIKVIAKSVIGIEAMMSGRRYQIENQAAENKVKPGVIGGISEVDSVVDTMLRGFSADFIGAVGRFQFPLESVEATVHNMLRKNVAQVIGAFNANSIEEFNSELVGSLSNIFGTGETRNYIYGVVTGLTSSFNDLTTAVNDLFKEINMDIKGRTMGGLNETPGREGATELPAGAVQPAATGGNIQPSPTPQRAGTAHVNPAQNMPASTILLEGNGNSLPNQPVSENYSPQQQGGGAQGGGQGQTDFNVNIGGSATINLVGDTGKLGEIDLIKMIEDNPTLRNEIARMISQAIADQNRKLGVAQ